jgi:hypothetical protein
MGIRLDDLERMDYGFVLDMMVESGNDEYKYEEVANQDDFDAF